MYQIGQVTRLLNISADTLRYYEKIELLAPIARTNAGLRAYNDNDLSRLRFIKRAQKMSFSLAEIAQLLTFREGPVQAKPEIRKLATDKLLDIEQHLQQLTILKNELSLLVNLCHDAADGCPIIDGIEQPHNEQ